MSVIIGIIKVLFLLGFLVFIHEGGHFCVAKLCKVKVKEFSIGFGPKIFKKQGIETEYSIRAIPLGGYVEMLGENKEVDEKRAFNNASIFQRLAIISAGAIVNVIFALVLYFILVSSSGINASTEVKRIIPEYVNDNSVIQYGDIIKKINGKNTRTKFDIDRILESSNGEEITVLIERKNEKFECKINPVKVENERYILGIEIKQAEKNLKNNIYYGFWQTCDFIISIKDGLVNLFSGGNKINQFAGPIGISTMIVKTDGIYNYIYLLAIISLSLGITNLLPIPALDGGKILLLIIEAIRRKKLSEEIELEIQSLGFTFLIVLSMYVSFNDILKLF